jgi:hypothetical protein
MYLTFKNIVKVNKSIRPRLSSQVEVLSENFKEITALETDVHVTVIVK